MFIGWSITGSMVGYLCPWLVAKAAPHTRSLLLMQQLGSMMATEAVAKRTVRRVLFFCQQRWLNMHDCDLNLLLHQQLQPHHQFQAGLKVIAPVLRLPKSLHAIPNAAIEGIVSHCVFQQLIDHEFAVYPGAINSDILMVLRGSMRCVRLCPVKIEALAQSPTAATMMPKDAVSAFTDLPVTEVESFNAPCVLEHEVALVGSVLPPSSSAEDAELEPLLRFGYQATAPIVDVIFLNGAALLAELERVNQAVHRQVTADVLAAHAESFQAKKRSVFSSTSAAVGVVSLASTHNLFEQVLLPESGRRVAWELGCLIGVLYYALVIPFRVAYWLETSAIAPSMFGWFALDWAVDLFFAVDIYMRLNVFAEVASNEADGLLITDPLMFRSLYFKTGFIAHCFASVPFEVIGLAQGSLAVSLLLRLVLSVMLHFDLPQTKLIRVRFIYKHFTRVKAWLIKKSAADISFEARLAVLEIVGLAALVLHAVACGFYLLSRQTGQAGDSTTTTPAVGWVFRDITIADNPSSTTKYIRSLYWVLTTWMTIGFGLALA